MSSTTPQPVSALAIHAADERKHNLTEDELRVLRRFIGGIVGGVFQALCSHPLDTVKSRVQHGVYDSAWTCLKETWHREGARGFYRGLTPPLVMGGIYNSILFSLNQYMNNLVRPAGQDPSVPLSLARIALAAQLTTPLYVLCITPMEKIKVQLQVQGADGVVHHRGPLTCIANVVRAKGLSGMLSGYIPACVSHLLGLPAYFVGYQYSRRALMATSLGSSKLGEDLVVPVVSGVNAGLCFWFSNYPLDFIKTKMQASKTRTTMREVIRTTYAKAGLRGFYKGFLACLLRSAPANASVWLGVDFTQRYMREHGW